MFGPTYKINAWGRSRWFLDIALVIYISAALWIMRKESIELIERIKDAITKVMP